MKKKIAIIGAGIAGLTLANFIKKYSEHEFMVYEKEESPSLDEGYGIQLASNSIKILIKFNDNTIDLVDLVIVADGIFSSTKPFFEKKKNEPKYKKALAIRVILKSKTVLNINDQNISLMLGGNSHIVFYPINKNKELNMVCIIRSKKYDPNNIKPLIENTIIKQNPNLKKIFDNEIKSWPLYFTPKILPSSNKKVFYIGDAFNGFLPTLAQGAGQSIESAYEIFDLLKNDKLDNGNTYFKERTKRANIVRKRSNFNFFVFHFSSSVMQKIRNIFLKFLVKRKIFIEGYLGKVYKN